MRTSLASISVSLVLIGCGDPAEPPEPVASVGVSPASDTLMVGVPRQFSARLVDATGNALGGRTVFWVSSDPDIAEVSTSGLATGLDNGTVTISATAEGIQGNADVLVRRPFHASVVTMWNGNACALDLSGTAFCWGFNWRGVLGTGFSNEQYVFPARVAGGHSFSTITTWDHTCALTASGQAYCWGDNSNGKLGDGTEIDRLVPVAVAGGLIFSDIGAGGVATCGIVDGMAQCWPANWLSPGPNAAFTSIAVGDSHACGVTSAHEGFCWGSNYRGQLGDGTTEHRTFATLVSGGLAFTSVVVGEEHSCGISTSGVAYCWGENGSGQLGDNSAIDRLVPTVVAGGHTFASISGGWSHTCGVTTSGVGYCWGSNSNGQVGDGTTTDRLTPSRVSGDHVFARIAAGAWQSCGIEADGSLLCWGAALVGDGTTMDRPVPTHVLLE